MEKLVLDLNSKIESYKDFNPVIDHQDLLRENENLKQKVLYIEKELNLTIYEKNKLALAFDEMRKKIEERVPIIASVEKRR